MTEAQTLLTAYAKDHSDSAFHELVSRYIDLVYSTALRLVGNDTHLAEDVTQTVFVALARSADKLPRDVLLGGWLHQVTRFTAGNTMRGERRRQLRERQAVEMNSLQDQSKNLEHVGPVLDEAIGRLAVDDQAAILLRFFEQQDFRTIGQALGSSEDAARMRVNRALEKLHSILKHHGSTLSVTGLATALASSAVSAAPTGLAASIGATALASAAAGTTTTLTLINLIYMTKTKITLIGALIIAGASTPVILQQQANARLRAQVENLQALEQQHARSEQSRGEALKAQADELARLRTEHDELIRLRSQASGASRQRQPTVAGAKPNVGKSQTPTESPSIPLIPATDWKNVGTASPSAAMQTLFWASSNKDTNAFINTLIWDADAKAKLDSLFAASPDSIRQEFGSVDGLIYQGMMGGQDTPMTGFGVVSVNTQGDEATLIEEHQYTDGKVRQNPIKLHREADGWRIVLDEKRLEKLGAYLRSIASQNRK